MPNKELIEKVIEVMTPELWEGGVPENVQADIRRAAEKAIPIIAQEIKNMEWPEKSRHHHGYGQVLKSRAKHERERVIKAILNLLGENT